VGDLPSFRSREPVQKEEGGKKKEKEPSVHHLRENLVHFTGPARGKRKKKKRKGKRDVFYSVLAAVVLYGAFRPAKREGGGKKKGRRLE